MDKIKQAHTEINNNRSTNQAHRQLIKQTSKAKRLSRIINKKQRSKQINQWEKIEIGK